MNADDVRRAADRTEDHLLAAWLRAEADRMDGLLRRWKTLRRCHMYRNARPPGARARHEFRDAIAVAADVMREAA